MADVTPMDERLATLLSCYLDGALTPDELSEVVFVLESNPEAVVEFRRLQEARRALRELPICDVPLYLLPGDHLGDQLSAYLDGELAPAEIAEVMSHLGTCKECRSELGDLDRSRTAVRSLPGLEPPEFIEVYRETQSEHRRGLRAAIAVASGVAAVTLAFTIGPLSSESEPDSISIADLQSRHVAVASVPSGAVGVKVSSTP